MTDERKRQLMGPAPADGLLGQYGLEVLVLEENRALLCLRPDPDCRDLRGQLHRALLYALADAAMTRAIQTVREGPLRAVNCGVDYPQQAEQSLGRLLAEGKVIRLGGKACFCEAQVWDADHRLLCRMDAVVAVTRPAREERGS